MRKRNSLIELYRFLFALNVVKSHGFFPYTGPYFGPGRISVEFFFVLTGFLLIRSINKYIDMSFWKGFGKFLKSKVWPILIPCAVAIPFNIFYKFLINEFPFDIWGYLWYVEAMLVVCIGYYIIRYFIRNNKAFLVTVASIFGVFVAINNTEIFYSWGYIRAIAGISLGILISYIPKINLKHQNLLWLILFPVQLIALSIVTFGSNLFIERIQDYIIYPMLVYFTFQIKSDNKVFNYLGGLSFGLYAYQCVTRPLEILGLTNVWILFGIIVLLTLIEDTSKRIYYFNKNKKIENRKKVIS